MPHQCTDCGRTFEDGSKEMLSGCPSCGGNKFQFHPDGVDADSSGTEEPPEPPEPAVDSSVARTVGNAATAVRDLVGSSSPPSGSEDEQPPTRSPADPGPDRRDQTATAERTDRSTDDSWNAAPTTDAGSSEMAQTEDEAQASARSEVVSPDDLPPAAETGTPSREALTPRDPDPTAESPPGGSTAGASVSESPPAKRTERPDLSELREELNEQFESIRVLEPGQYELNLMSLYDREEYIIALQEDGKYTIQVPERWEE